MDPSSPASRKICSLDDVLAHRAAAERSGERVVQCHGCFDIVHPGHVRHLEHARRLGERLLVSLTADEFIDKGVARPLFRQDLRAENLAALACVDWVLINPAPTAADLLARVQPDVYVKGAEYEHNEDPRFAAERDAVEGCGGRVVFTSGDVVFSSTALIEAMREGGSDEDVFAVDPSTIALRQLHQAHDLSPLRIRALLDALEGRRVTIIGESIIDTYVDCAWPDVTGEAPVLSLRPRQRVRFDGGAAVVARHIAAAGGRAHLVTPVPRSIEGEAMLERLAEAGIEVEVIPTESRLPEKERFLVGRDKLVKLDHTIPMELDHRTRTRVIESACHLGRQSDAAIVTDYGLGMLGPKLTADLFQALRPLVGTLAGDVSGARPSLLHMTEADWIAPSERELRGTVSSVVGSLPAVAAELMSRTRARHLAVTMADEGLVVFTGREETGTPDGQPVRLSGAHIPALNRAPIDTLGCGDALLAWSVLALVGGASPGLASYLGSLAASCCAGRLGNHACGSNDVFRHAVRLHAGWQSGGARTTTAVVP